MWVKSLSELAIHPPENFSHWLLKPKNLGDALRKIHPNVSVNLLKQEFGPPLNDESSPLDLNPPSPHFCFLRHIFLEINGAPFTFGRVVVPKNVYLNYQEEFNGLGNKLIGETLLYSNLKTTRGSFEYNTIAKPHPLFTMVSQALPNTMASPDFFWGRRSVFRMEGKDPILITELFLEEMSSYPIFPARKGGG